MTGAFGSKPKAQPLPPEPAPAPTYMELEETEGAKKAVKKRRGGRSSNILAGRMMAKRQTGAELKDILGA